jgi:Lar family restriction alleviation protein
VNLKPCPFCGGRSAIRTTTNTSYGVCLECNSCGPVIWVFSGATDKEKRDLFTAAETKAEEAWNKRSV